MTATKPEPSGGFFDNNFDLLRLLAATQVILLNHYATHFGYSSVYDGTFLARLFKLFSGVPIFFFISGFLISSSIERNSNLIEYAQNRCLRIFPALWACLFVSILLVVISGYPIFADLKAFGVWFGTQFFFPVYNPGFLRDYGVGALNGSLWTIPVELQFYIILPILYAIFALNRKKSFALKALYLSIAFYLIALCIRHFVFSGVTEQNEPLVYKLYSVSFIPHIFLFLFGVFFQQNFAFFRKHLANRFHWCLLLYVGYLYAAWLTGVHVSIFDGVLRLPTCFLLAMCCFSFAYSYSGVSQKLLRGNDISYGAYLYHMPIINFALYKLDGKAAPLWVILACVALTYILAFASWRLVERPCLKLKRHPLNPLNRFTGRKQVVTA